MKLRIKPSGRVYETTVSAKNLTFRCNHVGYCFLYGEQMTSICFHSLSGVDFCKIVIPSRILPYIKPIYTTVVSEIRADDGNDKYAEAVIEAYLQYAISIWNKVFKDTYEEFSEVEDEVMNIWKLLLEDEAGVGI